MSGGDADLGESCEGPDWTDRLESMPLTACVGLNMPGERRFPAQSALTVA